MKALILAAVFACGMNGPDMLTATNGESFVFIPVERAIWTPAYFPLRATWLAPLPSQPFE